MKHLWLCLLLCFGASLHAQSPVEWIVEGTRIKKGEYRLYITAKIQDGWAIYSQFIDEGGPVATSFDYRLPAGVTLSGKTEEESDHRIEGKDEIFEMEIVKFKEQVVFKQTLSSTVTRPTIQGTITFMCCDSEQCLPPKEVPFTFTFPK